MAYFVAKTLRMRPSEILTSWTVEELMVSFGEYANANALESWEMMTPKERRAKHKTWLDRWAVLFVPLEEAIRMSSQDVEQQQIDEAELQAAADILM